MSEPTNIFQSKQKQARTGQFNQLVHQVGYWQKLTQRIQNVLPQPENWQVAYYQHGLLIVTGTNQAMISQLGYLQQHYVAQLKLLPEFNELQKIRVSLRVEKQPEVSIKQEPKALPIETQQMLQGAAEFINDPKLSQAMRRLASVTK
ncbi:DUF721 domain-containing protein [Acinetobacter sp. MD2(2019)]|uniref:DUF721 domain-containing protein n=1 Tax=Acinetobacter sp. MD2(2019) TaxID=2605273 RepID=UPI002D1EBA95|nr:DUF721 domain-containing protein [Acinetobacter sp. MD2(2019)]MEB3753119.1 DUF721 domain-containing protein [Acinetobacter sp. MD2(2019)]